MNNQSLDRSISVPKSNGPFRFPTFEPYLYWDKAKQRWEWLVLTRGPETEYEYVSIGKADNEREAITMCKLLASEFVRYVP